MKVLQLNHQMEITPCASLEHLKALIMSVCLKDVINDVQTISNDGIKVGDETLEVDFYLGADWKKFLATVCGIESPNCTHACIWCTCPESQRYNGEKEWSITDVSKGARTIESISEGSKLSAKSKRKYNCAWKPLFPMSWNVGTRFNNLWLASENLIE